MRHPPLLLASVTLAIGAIGAIFLVGNHAWGSEWNVIGAGLLVLAVALWLGIGVARWVAAVAGVLALGPGLYGVVGGFVVAEQALMCAKRQVASSAASYPADFCEATNWVTHAGTGVALIGFGVIGVLTIVAVSKHAAFFARSRAAAQ